MFLYNILVRKLLSLRLDDCVFRKFVAMRSFAFYSVAPVAAAEESAAEVGGCWCSGVPSDDLERESLDHRQYS